MKKTYIIPRTEEERMDSLELLAGSGGIEDGEGTLGHEYNEGDVSYGRGTGFNEESEEW